MFFTSVHSPTGGHACIDKRQANAVCGTREDKDSAAECWKRRWGL